MGSTPHGSAAGGQEAGQRRHRDHDQRRPGDRQHIGRRQAEEQRRQETSGAEALATPIATPTATRIIDSRITRRRTSPRCAPSAMRMPISLVRRDTLYDIRPEEADRGHEQRQAAEERVGLREQLLLLKAPLDLLELRRHVHHRQVRVDLPDRLADA